MSARHAWSVQVTDAVRAAGIDPDDLAALIRLALEEDLDGGVDVTTVATVPTDQRATLDLVARASGVSAGARPGHVGGSEARPTPRRGWAPGVVPCGSSVHP